MFDWDLLFDGGSRLQSDRNQTFELVVSMGKRPVSSGGAGSGPITGPIQTSRRNLFGRVLFEYIDCGQVSYRCGVFMSTHTPTFALFQAAGGILLRRLLDGGRSYGLLESTGIGSVPQILRFSRNVCPSPLSDLLSLVSFFDNLRRRQVNLRGLC